METGVENLMSRIREEFALEEVDIRTYSPWCWLISGTVFLNW